MTTPAGDEEAASHAYVAILRRSFSKFRDDHLTSVAAALAYYAFLAIPSVLLVVVGIFGLLGSPDSAASLVNRLGGVMPDAAQMLLRDSLAQLTTDTGAGVAILVVGLVLALWSLMGAMQNVMWGLNIAYGREETRGFVRQRLTALAMVGFAGGAVLLVFGLLVLGPHLTGWIGDAVGHKTLVSWIWWTAQWPILLLGLIGAFAGLLYLGPNVEQRRWRFLSLGAGLTIVLFLALSGAFAFYASRFGSYNKTWGSLSAVVVMLTWLWLSSVALLFGAEVSAQAERNRAQRFAGSDRA
jgi:membrane protein